MTKCNGTIPIKLGEIAMNHEKTLNIAKAICESKENKNISYQELSSQYGLTRPHLINHIRLHKLPDPLKAFFLEGHINFIPLIDAYDKYGIACLPAIRKCIDANTLLPKNRSRKVTLPQIKSQFTETAEMPVSDNARTEIAASSPASNDHAAIKTALIRKVLLESSLASNSYNQLILTEHSCSVILNALSELESFLGIDSDRANAAIASGDTTATKAHTQSLLDIDQSPEIDYENISQDIYDYS